MKNNDQAKLILKFNRYLRKEIKINLYTLFFFSLLLIFFGYSYFVKRNLPNESLNNTNKTIENHHINIDTAQHFNFNKF